MVFVQESNSNLPRVFEKVQRELRIWVLELLTSPEIENSQMIDQGCKKDKRHKQLKQNNLFDRKLDLELWNRM